MFKNNNPLYQRIKAFSDEKLIRASMHLEDYNLEAQNFIQEEMKIRCLSLPDTPDLTAEEQEAIFVKEQPPALFSIEEDDFFSSIVDMPFEETDGIKIYFQSEIRKTILLAKNLMEGIKLFVYASVFLFLVALWFVDVEPYLLYLIMGLFGLSICFIVLQFIYHTKGEKHQFLLIKDKGTFSIRINNLGSLFLLSFPFSYQLYSSRVQFFQAKTTQARLYIEKDGESFVLTELIPLFHSSPPNCRPIHEMKSISKNYYHIKMGHRKIRALVKVLNTIARNI